LTIKPYQMKEDSGLCDLVRILEKTLPQFDIKLPIRLKGISGSERTRTGTSRRDFKYEILANLFNTVDWVMIFVRIRIGLPCENR
jgi:hypothetical protein